jgi:Asp-tRNA(Asn)/Glu-tRNA(Gln) amidotransferase A subunit family amidase
LCNVLFVDYGTSIITYDLHNNIVNIEKGGGSIRIPAAWNGVVGLATTFGRLGFEKRHGSTMIKGGPIAATVDDAAIAYMAMVIKEREASVII